MSSWYGDAPATAAVPALGLFFPVNVTMVNNTLGVGVGYDNTNVAQQQALCGGAGCNITSWSGVPAGAQKWGSYSYPAPFVMLPASAWPSCTGGVMSFAGANYTAPPPAAASSGARAAGARAAGVLVAAAALALAL